MRTRDHWWFVGMCFIAGLFGYVAGFVLMAAVFGSY